MPPNPDTLRFVELWRMDGPPLVPNADAGWRRITEAGNAAFAAGDLVTAERRYGEAIAEAQRQFDSALQGGDPLLAPMLHTIACHNAAELQRSRGDVPGARGLLVNAIEKLLGTAESSAAPLALRANCLRHLRHALAFLAEFRENEIARTEAVTFVARARAAEAKLAGVHRRLSESGTLAGSHPKLPRNPH